MAEITGYIHCAGCGLLIERDRGITCHPQCKSEAARREDDDLTLILTPKICPHPKCEELLDGNGLIYWCGSGHIFDAEALHSSSAETGWLIEKRPALYGGAPQWLIASWTFEWTTDSAKAIRFCRREDAEQVASMLESEEVSITEHQWGS